MNVVELEKKLMAVARANPPSDRVPHAFSRRMTTLISTRPVNDLWAAWAKGLWYAAAPCVAIMLLFSTWAFVQSHKQAPSIDLAQQLNSTLLAAVDQNNSEPSW